VATPTDTAALSLRELGFRGAVEIISNGVDCIRFSPGRPDDSLRSALGIDPGPVILYTGRLDADKDMDTWLRAVAVLRKTQSAQFVVGGNGADRARLERQAVEFGIGADVHFVGYVSEDRFPEIYRLADLYFISSPVELQSITTLEAMATGLPVVAARAGALPELVTDDQNGYLFAPGDASTAAHALACVLQDGEKGRAMGHESRVRALGHDLTESLAAYERLLEVTCRTRTGAARERATVVEG
jgi:glycosyltransferase involved in cell wall biosynthesis